MKKPEKRSDVEPDVREILFSCRAPEANAVNLAGTFNNWNPTATPMERSREPTDGAWCARLKLPAGRHEFKYIIDGRWCCDPGIDEKVPKTVPNNYGSLNHVIEIPVL